MAGKKANFFVYYEVDQMESCNVLELEDYGKDFSWVLLI